MVLDRTLLGFEEDVVGDDVRNEGHHSQVGAEALISADGFLGPHAAELEDGYVVILGGGLQGVRRPTLAVRGTEGADHVVAPFHQGVEHALSKGLLADDGDTEPAGHCTTSYTDRLWQPD